ncbi:hypothetical protein HDU88_000493 [Geranomyces variabilis]|nr:hypothetical protein HDU88_000493 [Geranomyces variabilis]
MLDTTKHKGPKCRQGLTVSGYCNDSIEQNSVVLIHIRWLASSLSCRGTVATYKVEDLEAILKTEKALHAALLEAEKAKCDAKIARAEGERQVLLTKLEYERRLAERNAEELKRLREEVDRLRQDRGRDDAQLSRGSELGPSFGSQGPC